jgi:hypothetical protein
MNVSMEKGFPELLLNGAAGGTFERLRQTLLAWCHLCFQMTILSVFGVVEHERDSKFSVQINCIHYIEYYIYIYMILVHSSFPHTNIHLRVCVCLGVYLRARAYSVCACACVSIQRAPEAIPLFQ